jgi:gamma-glutamyltranspeptidase / glutathione hydrolase
MSRMRVGLFLTVALALASGQQRRPAERLVRYPSRGTHAAVAAGSEYATQAGMRMFYAGGNAVDAGVASLLAAAVSEFSHIGMGGEAPILVRTKEGKVFAIAGIGTMPKLATADFFRNRPIGKDEMENEPEPNGLSHWLPVVGIMPALVPGIVEGSLVALREFGTKSFSDVIQPAIDLADGFPLDEMRANSIARSAPYLSRWPASKKVFLPNGHAPLAGEILRQPDLARTLRSMAAAEENSLAAGATRAAAIDAVRDFFYRGDIARRIDAFSRQNGGLLRYEDMAAFRVAPEEPVSTTFRGYTVYKPGFWSQGPAMIETLNTLDGFDLHAMGQNSAPYIHTLVEALKLAYADRDTYYGDPKFVRIPADKLLSKEYGSGRAKLIGENASQDFRPGDVMPNPPRHPSLSDTERRKIDDALLAKDTTCIDAIDKDGMAFSATPSGAWMPSYIAGDTGIPLTQRAQSFLLIPGHPNELAPGKRPRVTLSPTLVTRPDGTLLALSTPGGDNQEQSLIQVLFNSIMWDMNAQAAIEAPRFQTEHLVSSFDNHAMNPGSLLLDERTPASVVTELERRKHKVEMRSRYNSGAAPVLVRSHPSGLIEAGADPYYYRDSQAW